MSFLKSLGLELVNIILVSPANRNGLDLTVFRTAPEHIQLPKQWVTEVPSPK
jgi:hypothetical protein